MIKFVFSIFLFCICFVYAGPAGTAHENYFRYSFSDELTAENLPAGWIYRSGPFMSRPFYRVLYDHETGTKFLRIVCGSLHSGSIITRLPDGLLKKYPIMRWKWRVNKLPAGADGRTKKDDQAISVYVGTGNVRRKSVAYRWESETPKGYQGHLSYNAGFVKVAWFAVRNKTDLLQKWYVEERNVLADYQRFYGPMPDAVALSVTANAQHTKTNSSADILYIDFHALPGKR